MSWVETTYEKAMKTYFIEELERVEGEQLYIEYVSVRNSLISDNFFSEIKGQESNLSDHSSNHIRDVLERTYKVIGEEEFKKLNVYEVYCLAIMILFHDVGNIFGRKGHNSIQKIAEIYNQYRNNPNNYREERRLITLGASAHSGKSKNDDHDTLQDITAHTLKGHSINLPELAAILRFSDELAEGQQRTCSFMIEKNLFNAESIIYHKYAQITSIAIDRKLERISITYDMDIPADFNEEAQQEFKALLLFTYHRAVKLDTERRYTKYYSDVIKAFKYVVVQYNFTSDGIPIEIDLSRVIFQDRYPIPGSDACETKDARQLFENKNEEYNLDKLIQKILLKIA